MASAQDNRGKFAKFIFNSTNFQPTEQPQEIKIHNIISPHQTPLAELDFILRDAQQARKVLTTNYVIQKLETLSVQLQISDFDIDRLISVLNMLVSYNIHWNQLHKKTQNFVVDTVMHLVPLFRLQHLIDFLLAWVNLGKTWDDLAKLSIFSEQHQQFFTLQEHVMAILLFDCKNFKIENIISFFNAWALLNKSLEDLPKQSERSTHQPINVKENILAEIIRNLPSLMGKQVLYFLIAWNNVQGKWGDLSVALAIEDFNTNCLDDELIFILARDISQLSIDEVILFLTLWKGWGNDWNDLVINHKNNSYVQNQIEDIVYMRSGLLSSVQTLQLIKIYGLYLKQFQIASYLYVKAIGNNQATSEMTEIMGLMKGSIAEQKTAISPFLPNAQLFTPINYGAAIEECVTNINRFLAVDVLNQTLSTPTILSLQKLAKLYRESGFYNTVPHRFSCQPPTEVIPNWVSNRLYRGESISSMDAKAETFDWLRALIQRKCNVNGKITTASDYSSDETLAVQISKGSISFGKAYRTIPQQDQTIAVTHKKMSGMY